MVQIQVVSFSEVGSNTARVQEDEVVGVLSATHRNREGLLATGVSTNQSIIEGECIIVVTRKLHAGHHPKNNWVING